MANQRIQNEATLGTDATYAEEMPSDRVADLVEYIVCGLVTDEDAVTLVD